MTTPNPSDGELEACPCCGSPAGTVWNGRSAYAECDECELMTGWTVPGLTEEAARAWAVSAWNRRTPPAACQSGWQLVPIEPDMAMKIAGDNAGFWCADKYRAMCSAAPPPPAAAEGKGEAISAADGMEAIRKAMREDYGYAWSWHCNVAMAAYDAGAPIDKANERAAQFMRNAFDIDTSSGHPKADCSSLAPERPE